MQVTVTVKTYGGGGLEIAPQDRTRRRPSPPPMPPTDIRELCKLCNRSGMIQSLSGQVITCPDCLGRGFTITPMQNALARIIGELRAARVLEAANAGTFSVGILCGGVIAGIAQVLTAAVLYLMSWVQ